MMVLTGKIIRTKQSDLFDKYMNYDFIGSNDPYQRLFGWLNDYFNNHTTLTRGEWTIIVLRALMGSCEVKERGLNNETHILEL